MEKTAFDTMVAKVERESAASPGMYRFKVTLLALLGLGVLATIIGTAGLGLLVLAGGALLVAFSGTGALILVLKLGKLLIFLALPLWVLVKSSISALFVRFPVPQGTEIQAAQAPALFEAMAQMRRSMKGPRFHHVLITDDVNAAVVQRPLLGLFGWQRNYLILGLPLLESLSPKEALAVVAHEYGHLAGSHSRFGAYIYRLRHSWGTVQSFTEQWQSWAGKPLSRLVGWYAPYFNAYTFVLARANEYQADAASAELVGADVAANALKRVHLASAQRDRFMKDVLDSIAQQARPPEDLAVQWSRIARQDLDEACATGWLRDALGRELNTFDTHPALTQRLQALLKQEHQMATLPATYTGPSAADAWLGAHLSPLRKQVQEAWRDSVEAPWRQRHQELQQLKQRLTALLARDDLDADEQLESIRLRQQLERDHDALPDLHAYNQQHADRALALYLEASLRLERDDETGLPLLDRVMALDKEAIKPACEAAHAFWMKRGDRDNAEAFADRWRARDQMETQRAHELDRLDVKHTLRDPADLEEDAIQTARAHVKSMGADVAKAYLVRRILPSDSQARTYVLVLELSLWARMRSKKVKIIQQLAAREWPMHLLICTVHGEYAALKKKVEAVKGARLT